MADQLSGLAQAYFRKALSLSNLEVVVDSAWGSACENFRVKIREALIRDYGKTDFQKSELSDLQKIPPAWISISHENIMGGFAVLKAIDQERADRSNQKFLRTVAETSELLSSIGFDLVEKKRVLKKVVDRISTVDEQETNIDPAWRWAAKESAFKAFQSPALTSKISGGNPTLLSQIEISFTQIDSRSGTFTAKILSDLSSQKAQGSVIELEGVVLSVSVCST